MSKLNKLIMGFILFLAVGCQEEELPQSANGGNNNSSGLFEQGNGVTDIDGNSYPTIIINGQEWMQKNLSVTKYRNGDSIPTGLSNFAWQNTQSGACAVNFDYPPYDSIYGKLYNWYAVNDSRGLCPLGWRVPSYADWSSLLIYLDPSVIIGGNYDTSLAGGKLKSVNGWEYPNIGATNESGFSALPGSLRHVDGTYVPLDFGYQGYWWSSTPSDTSGAGRIMLSYIIAGASLSDGANKQAGFSVRCVRD